MNQPMQTHRLDLGSAGSAGLRLTFSENEISAEMDLPTNLKRRDRRFVYRWSRGIFQRLDGDPRTLRETVTIAGRVVSIGMEINGIGFVFSK